MIEPSIPLPSTLCLGPNSVVPNIFELFTRQISGPMPSKNFNLPVFPSLLIFPTLPYEIYPESKDTSPVKMQRIFFSEMAVLPCEIGTV
jgi:hypothetical protein